MATVRPTVQTPSDDLEWMLYIACSQSSPLPPVPGYEETKGCETLQNSVRKHESLESEKVKEISLRCLRILSAVLHLWPKGYLPKTFCPADCVVEGEKIKLVGFLKRGVTLAKEASLPYEVCIEKMVFFHAAPEVLMHNPEVNPEKALLWGVALMLHALITGDYPIEQGLKLKEHAEQKVRLAPELSSSWKSVLSACLDRDPEKRPTFDGAARMIEQITFNK